MDMRVSDQLTSVRAGRRWVAEVCGAAGLGDDACEVAVLLTSEVLTNALTHGSPPVLLSATPGEGSGALRISVRDAGTDLPVVRSPDPEDLGGRGMVLLDVLALAWGVVGDGTGKTVWFDLAG